MLAGEGLLFLKQVEGFVFDGTDSDKNSEFLASFHEWTKSVLKGPILSTCWYGKMKLCIKMTNIGKNSSC